MNKTIAAAALVLGFAGAPAIAADLIIVDPVVVAPTSAYDWEGLYAGVSGGIWLEGSPYPYLGGVLGTNFVQGDMLLGIEGSAEFFPTSSVLTGDVSGRIGLIMDNVVLYGVAGIGLTTAPASPPHFFGGVGAELGLTENVSLAGQAEVLSIGVVRGETSLRFHF